MKSTSSGASRHLTATYICVVWHMGCVWQCNSAFYSLIIFLKDNVSIQGWTPPAHCLFNCSLYCTFFIAYSFLALLNRFMIRRDYVIPNICVVHLRHRCCSSCSHRHCRNHQLFVQTLSPLMFRDRLPSNVMCDILVWVTTKVI